MNRNSVLALNLRGAGGIDSVFAGLALRNGDLVSFFLDGGSKMKALDAVKFGVSTTIILASSFLAGCGSAPTSFTQPTPTPAPTVTVTIAPASIGMRHDSSVSFNASVFGSDNLNLMWSIKEGASGGTISSSGNYTAPSTLGVYHVVATSQAEPSKSATATVTVTASGVTSISGLNYPRLQHTATLLPDGKVLIAGGGEGPDIIDGYSVVDQAELFDPGTKTFSVAGQIARDSHTATLLQSGDVLLAGGETGWSPNGNAYGNPEPIDSATAEVDQESSEFSVTATGSMLTVREGHSASILNDGKVLITGGLFALSASPWWQALDESEVFDPASGKFTAVGPMTSERWGHTSTLLQNGKVLITGGGSSLFSNTAELFDPGTGTFKVIGNMAVQRGGHTATLLPDGKVLIAGNSAMAEVYDPSTELFSPTGTMNTARQWHTATLLPNGTVLIAGGYLVGSGSINTTEIYDPATGEFTLGPSLAQDRFSHTATLLPNGDVLIVGGASSANGVSITPLTSAEIYH